MTSCGLQLGNPVDEGRDQLLFGSRGDAGRAQRIHNPAVIVLMGNQRADADDRVVDVLRKLVADGGADLVVGLAIETLGGRKPLEVGDGLDIPGDDAGSHWRTPTSSS